MPFYHKYHGINVELTTDNSLTGIVSGRFDAGIRLGVFPQRTGFTGAGRGATNV